MDDFPIPKPRKSLNKSLPLDTVNNSSSNHLNSSHNNVDATSSLFKVYRSPTDRPSQSEVGHYSRRGQFHRGSYSQRFSQPGQSAAANSPRRGSRGRGNVNYQSRDHHTNSHNHHSRSIGDESSSASRGRNSPRESPHQRPNTRRSSSGMRSEEERRQSGKFSTRGGRSPHHNGRKAGAGTHEFSSPIPYPVVREMVENDDIKSRAIVLRLSTDSSGFSQRLKLGEDEFHDGWVQMILKLFAKLSRDEDPNHYFNQLLMQLIHCNFHIRVYKLLKSAFTGHYVNKENATGHVSNALLLMKAWLIQVPNSCRFEVEMLMPFIKSRLDDHELEETKEENVKEMYHEVEKLFINCNKIHQQKANPEKLIDLHNEDPPDDFRTLSVFPTKHDVYEQNPFVRVNLVSSAYKSTEHYLDVQFRLLREDFIRPLREGISEFFNSRTFNPGKKKHRLEGIKIYPNVQIEFPKLSSKGITYCLRFDIAKLKFVHWRNSKRLIYGNLICLSSDNFTENFLFASITERSLEDLQNGYIEVQFLNCESARADVDGDLDEEGDNAGEASTCLITAEDMKKTYDMAESEAYFEAYRHVLSGLQETQVVPLRQYIVDCQPVGDSPRYLRGLGRTATYDFAPIIDKEGRSDSPKPYDVLNTYTWPDADTLGLDPSQVAALKSALTQELSIIQGPPGTGKTYVGLMIMKILLHNRNSQADKLNDRLRRLNVEPVKSKCVPPGPILVVCYTNHALDQFLEGISSFHPRGLVRVGGRGKNKDLEQYNLTSVRRKVTTDKFMRRTFFQIRSDLSLQVEAVEHSQEILRATTDSILTFEVLGSVMSKEHYQQLKRFEDIDKSSDPILLWLGAQKKTDQIPTELTYVVEETLKVVMQFYALNGVSENRVVQAIICQGSIAAEHLAVCLFGHDHGNQTSRVNPDIIYQYLADYMVNINVNKLKKMGFHVLEIKCACFVFDSQPQPSLAAGMPRENALIEWMRQKRGEDIDDSDDEDDLDANFEEEAEYMQDQRMIDGEEDVFLEIDRKVRRPGQQKVNTKITAAKRNEIVYTADFSDVEEGFQLSREEVRRRKKKLKNQMRRELVKQDAFKESEVEAIDHITYLSFEDKWKLYRYWVHKLVMVRRKILAKHSLKYNKLVKQLDDMKNQEAFQVLENADVIAMTTTGAAKYRDMIYKIPVSIMIVEEAAEVLEAHIVTSMPKTTQHLILIGDHQQLKPSPTVYDLAKKYNLDMSLFERMVKNGIPCSRLELQHRMRPRIADLIRPHIYDNLRDHESVLTYDDITGVKSNVFFLSHNHMEDNVMDSKSKVNQHEANFMIGLCSYLLQQGYSPDRITILTAYVGQLLAFKKSVGGKLDRRIRITAVDNFQGEENDIILLSLVRSNVEGKIGFLSIENRVCVALSRAKKGLYCIGNFKLLKQQSQLWRKILEGLERDELSGEEFPLQCKNHPEKVVMVKCLKDFEKVPEGGCGQPCAFRLECGHKCVRFCHPDDDEHKQYTCMKVCEKTCPEGHKTSVKCHAKLTCRHLVEKLMPVCGHYIHVECHKDPLKTTCTNPCEKKLACGHDCTNICGVRCTQQCGVMVDITAACGHQVKVKCSERNSFNIKKCTAKCNEMLQCGHPCRGTCGACKQGRLHVGCSNSRCGRVLCCGHVCPDKCTAVCPPCQRKCETSCRHSNCPKMCCEPCVLCREPCDWKCKHYHCTKLCSEPCDRPPCNQPCPEVRKCGHPCIGLCGEPCPRLCRVCDKSKVEELFFGDEDEKDARFVQLECGHIFTYEGLDHWMNQENTNEGSETDIKLKECPRCKTPIRKSARYGNIVNKTLMMINQVRQKISGNPAEVNDNRAKLVSTMNDDTDVKATYPHQYEKLVRSAMTAKSNPDLSLVEFQYTCLAEFAEIKQLLEKVRRRSTTLGDLVYRIADILNWLMQPRYYFSEQEKEDLNQERQRCRDILKLIQLKEKMLKKSSMTLNSDVDAKIDELVKSVQSHVEDIFAYSPLKQTIVIDAFKEINRLMPRLLPGLGITNDERKMILSAIDLSPGHWFKCKNGHVYCIGECGGAMEESKCPECKEKIGGMNHALSEGNQLASEMDGASRPTWDPNNFDIPEEVRRWQLE